MIDRKEGLEPRIRRIEIASWTNDAESADCPEYGFGVTGFIWFAHRRRWWISRYHQWYKTNRELSIRVKSGEPRPVWQKETVECWKMLNLKVLCWSKVVNISIRLWKVPWAQSTIFS